MPIYHFDVHDGHSYPDPLGSEHADLQAVRVEAVRRSGQFLSAQGTRFWTGEVWTMDVSDDSGLTLFRLMFLATDAPLASGSETYALAHAPSASPSPA